MRTGGLFVATCTFNTLPELVHSTQWQFRIGCEDADCHY